MTQATELLARARTFIYSHARLLDRMRFAYHFEEGSRGAVLDVLRAYQNADGGFGNALEPDIRCPHSQPVPTEMALMIMNEIDSFDPAVLAGIARYMEKATLAEGGLPLVTRIANDYPHAPWWTTDSDDRPSINPTGTIIGLLYKQQAMPELIDTAWFQRCVSFIWQWMEQGEISHYHDAVQWIHFLEHTPEKERAAAHWKTIDAWLSRPGVIEKNVAATGYVQKVLDWAPSADSYARSFATEAELQQHLQAMIAEQREDGGWPISFDAVSPAGEQEWRGWLTVERLKTLRSYGVI